MAKYCMWDNKLCLHEKEEKPLYCCKCLLEEMLYYRNKIKNMERYYTKENTINGRELGNIDNIIVMLDCAAQIGASATIDKESVPVLLAALKPVIEKRAEYWQGLNVRCTLRNEEKEATK